ncbi:MAG TPA: carboxypeptidase-like regulatory domain-containing protein [Candidatus Thermoplasmatota archaeon]|nr:carboxypeptidase-like regulatory domain-containing protein [Candidatus Thermoplasmatota archaeon]
MVGRGAAVFLFLMGAILAGCASTPRGSGTQQDPQDASVQATATTGIIRGIVVDPAIRPLAGVSILVRPGNATATTNGAGSFGVQGLAPGTYFVTASKPGFDGTQQSTEVVADRNDPLPLRILLQAKPGTAPYHDVTKFRGYLASSSVVDTPVGPVASSSSTDVLGNNGTFSDYFAYSPNPMWQQSVMVWSANQAATTNLRLDECIAVEATEFGCSDPVAFTNTTAGASPLIVTADAKMMQALAGNETLKDSRIVWSAGSVTGGPVDIGYAFDQEFTLFTVHTYNYAPPAGYRFDKDGEPIDPVT